MGAWSNRSATTPYCPKVPFERGPRVSRRAADVLRLELLMTRRFRRRPQEALVRTTLTLDPDIAAKARKGAAKLGKPLKEIINAALRIGLEQVLNPSKAKPYCTTPRPMGLREGLSYDNIGELLARAEAED